MQHEGLLWLRLERFSYIYIYMLHVLVRGDRVKERSNLCLTDFVSFFFFYFFLLCCCC